MGITKLPAKILRYEILIDDSPQFHGVLETDDLVIAERLLDHMGQMSDDSGEVLLYDKLQACILTSYKEEKKKRETARQEAAERSKARERCFIAFVDALDYWWKERDPHPITADEVNAIAKRFDYSVCVTDCGLAVPIDHRYKAAIKGEISSIDGVGNNPDRALRVALRACQRMVEAWARRDWEH